MAYRAGQNFQGFMKSGGFNQGPGSTAVKILVGLGAAAYGITSSLYNGSVL